MSSLESTKSGPIADVKRPQYSDKMILSKSISHLLSEFDQNQ